MQEKKRDRVEKNWAACLPAAAAAAARQAASLLDPYRRLSAGAAITCDIYPWVDRQSFLEAPLRGVKPLLHYIEVATQRRQCRRLRVALHLGSLEKLQ